MRLEDAIEDVLKKRGSMNCADIADHIRKSNMARLEGKTPAATVRAVIARSPERFVRVSRGVYGVKHAGQNTGQDSNYYQSIPQRSIEYQYTERFVDMTDGGYHRINLDRIGKMVIGKKPFVLKTLNTEFTKLTESNFPCVYVLGINIKQKEAYVGESYEGLVRIKYWRNNKDYKYAAIFHADELSTDNIRLNIERVLMKWLEDAGWALQNKNKTVREISETDQYAYEHIEKIIPIVGYKINCMFEMYDDMDITNAEPRKGKDPKKPKRKRGTWSESLERADAATRKLALEAINHIQDNVGGTTFESAWLYFGDGDASRKRAFVALAVGKRWLDLVFLAPDGSPLPKTARWLKPFVLPRKSECRLRLDRTNLKDVVEIAAKSRDYMRSLDKRKQYGVL